MFSKASSSVLSQFSNSKLSILKYLLIVVLALVAMPSRTFGQNATVVGTVTDPQGGVVAGVTVTITSLETGAVKTIQTNESGSYVVPDLPIGRYNIKASASGFKVAEQKDVKLQVGDRLRIDFQMAMGAATETVTVEANPIAVQSDSGEVSNMITSDQMSQISTNGRSFYVLAGLTAGASSNVTGLLNVPVGGDSNVSFNGQRTGHNIYLLDGGEDLDRGGSGNMSIAPSTDAIAEFRAMTSNYSADYGLSSSATMTMVLKSGSSTLHASAWEFNRQDGFDARDFFHPASGGPATKLRMNIFGFNVGGPVTLGKLYNSEKKKTFFFYNMEWRRYIIGAGSNQDVPDPATYGGDFSTAGLALADLHAPFSCEVSPAVQTAFGNAGQALSGCTGGVRDTTKEVAFNNSGVIDPTLLNTNATALVAAGIFPSTSLANKRNGIATFRGGSGAPTSLKEEVVRIDHNFSSRFSVFGHFVAEQISQGYSNAQWSGDNVPTVGDTFNNPSYSGVVHATYTINPSLINETAFNYNGNRINIIPFAANGLSSLALPSGYDSTNSRLFTGPNNLSRIPNISLDGQSSANFQIASWPWVNKADDYQIRDDVSWTHGAHQFKFGGSWAIYKKVQDLFGTTQGAFTFSGKGPSYTGNSFADLLLGLPQSYSELAVQDHGFWNNVSWAAYVQDNWRATRRLTLNLGLRWDGIPHTYEANNRMGNFYPSLYDAANAATFNSNNTICASAADPGCTAVSPGLGTSPNPILAGVPLYLNGIGTPGQNGVPKGLVDNYWATFGPRLGFAYDLTGNGKTILRGGFGLMYERIQGNDMYNAGPNIPFSLNVTLNNTEFSNPSISTKTGTSASRPINPASLTGLDRSDYRPSTSTQYSLGIQRSLSAKTVLSVSYVGNVNRHLNDYRNINLPAEANLPGLIAAKSPYQTSCAPGLPAACGVTFPGFTQITQSENEANSSYNSLQVDMNSQVKDLQLRVLYTYSRAIDSSNGGSGGDLANVSNPYAGWKFDLGPGNSDRTHILVANFIYDIPVFRHSSSRLLKATVGGWQVSGIATIESGLPINLSAGSGVSDFLGSGAASRPDINGKISYVNQVLTTGTQQVQYFDPSVFSVPSSGTFGNLGHNALRGPGRDNWDMSLFKNFTISESRGSRFELRLETFNTWNHTQFQNVNTSKGDAKFGQFTSAYAGRTLQLGGKIYF